MLELMQCGDLSPDQRQLADAMQQCSRALTTMLDGGITIPGLEAHLHPARIGLIDLPGKIEATINMFLGWAARQSVQLAYSISVDTPTVVLADGQRLQQVLNNLVSNAIKYAAGSTVLVRVSRIEAIPLKLKISVIDHGRRPRDDKQVASGWRSAGELQNQWAVPWSLHHDRAGAPAAVLSFRPVPPATVLALRRHAASCFSA
jgi:K+-sensing histidine kinase KdpD